jgi:hypothetical protein
MRSLSTLQKRLDAMHKRISPGRRRWHIVLPAGESIPADIEAQFRPGDSVLINEIPAGFLGEIAVHAWCEEQFS